MATKKKCRLSECTKPLFAKGKCNTHYYREYREKNPPVRNDTDWTNWRLNTNGYRTRTRYRAGKVQHEFEHRIVMESLLGRKLVAKENVHHLNGNRADNRPENLELWVTMQPKGQRPSDLVQYAREILARYESLVE